MPQNINQMCEQNETQQNQINEDEIKYKKKKPWLYSNDQHFAKKNLE